MKALQFPTLILSILLTLLIRTTSATTGVFSNPPAAGATRDYSANQIYYTGDTIDANWTTKLTNSSFFVTQERTKNIIPLFLSLNNTTSYSWIVSLHAGSATFNLTGNSSTPGNVFYFSVADASGSGGGSFISHYFNISDGARASGPAADNSSSTQPANTTVTSSTSSNGSSLSIGAQAAIGATASVVGVAAVVGLGFLLARWRRRRAANGRACMGKGKSFETDSVEIGGGVEKGRVYMLEGTRRAELTGERRVEIPADEWYAELPADTSPRIPVQQGGGMILGNKGRGWLGNDYVERT